MELMGPALRKLHYTPFNHRDMVAELSFCTALEEFTCNIHNQGAVGLLPHLSKTIHTIIFDDHAAAHSADDLLSDLLRDPSQRPSALAAVRLETSDDPGSEQSFDDEDEKERFEAVVDPCDKAGVELVGACPSQLARQGAYLTACSYLVTGRLRNASSTGAVYVWSYP